MPNIEQRLTELGITLPAPPAPVASYVPYTISGNLVVISGQIPIEGGKPHHIGKLGADISLEDGKAAAKAVLAAVAAHREEFEFARHCGGPNLDATPNEIISRLEAYSGVELAAAFAIPDLDREIKWHCKYARQNGIHVSPTFMIDGLVQADMGSGDSVESWVAKLLPA